MEGAKIDLTPLCCDHRHAIKLPWVGSDGRVYAVNGKVFAVCERDAHADIEFLNPLQITASVHRKTEEWVLAIEKSAGPDISDVLILPATVAVKTDCKACAATGKAVVCPECEGRGEVCWDGEFSHHEYSDSCEFCDGVGILDPQKAQSLKSRDRVPHGEEKCDWCDGVGTVESFPDVELGPWKFEGKNVAAVQALPDISVLFDARIPGYTFSCFRYRHGCGALYPQKKDETK